MITVRLKGGLGNQMFEYALAKALSVRRKEAFQLDLRLLNDRSPRRNFVFRKYDLDLFNVDPAIMSPSKYMPYAIYGVMGIDKFNRAEKMPGFLQSGSTYYEKGSNYDKSIWEQTDKTYFDGYFQSYKYFEQINEEILKDFTFRSPMNENSILLRDEIRSKNSICLNVRRGDFVTGEVVTAIPTSYHHRAVDYLKGKVTDGHIYVFSDEIDWCMENLSFDLPTTFVTHEYKGERFRDYMGLMMNCRHFVIPNSSFAWWAAFLAEYKQKIIIAPKNWFQVDWLDSSDLIPLDWIRL